MLNKIHTYIHYNYYYFMYCFDNIHTCACFTLQLETMNLDKYLYLNKPVTVLVRQLVCFTKIRPIPSSAIKPQYEQSRYQLVCTKLSESGELLKPIIKLITMCRNWGSKSTVQTKKMITNKINYISRKTLVINSQ